MTVIAQATLFIAVYRKEKVYEIITDRHKFNVTYTSRPFPCRIKIAKQALAYRYGILISIKIAFKQNGVTL